MDVGTYELLRQRLEQQARDLSVRVDELNTARLAHFGATALEPLASQRIRTANNCVPRDIAAVGDQLLFGYNVFIGLRSETQVADVFSLHRLADSDGDGSFELDEITPDDDAWWLSDQAFQADFTELYTYYRNARLLQLRRTEGRLLMVFQIGDRLDDLRVFRWSVSPSGAINYLDNRGERDHTFPPNQDFEWTIAGREHHVAGRHPHVNILDEVFVETVGGDLTIKIENNTEDGLGIHREPVDEPTQALADADIAYARVGGLVLVMVRPYKEHAWRHYVFNTRTRAVERIDAIGQACQQLPEDHGIIFPGGYHLMTGETRAFATDAQDMIFGERIRSPNGEDVLYVFHGVAEGRSLLLSYNMIRKAVAAPIPCHGFSLFADGTLVIFHAASPEPTRVHPMQLWRTPYQSDEHVAAQPLGRSFFDTVGNASLVRGISEALALTRLVEESTPSRAVFDDLAVTAARLVDQHHWLGDPEAGELAGAVRQIAATGALVLDEFERAEALRSEARRAVADSAEALDDLARQLAVSPPTSAEAYVQTLATLRRQQGHLESLREMRYADRTRIDELAASVSTHFDGLAGQAVDFLGRPEAFSAQQARLTELADTAEGVQAVSECGPLAEELDSTGADLEILTEVVGALEMSDARARTGILEQISAVLGTLNRARALLEGRRRELRGREATAEFGAELVLFEQAATAALAAATTPDTCDEQLAKLILALEALDGRFGDLDDFGIRLATKRDDLYEAFAGRRQALVDERQRSAQRLADAGSRLIDAVARRVETFDSLDAINTFYAGDQLVARLRTTASQLRELDDAVRAGELERRLQATREDATRSLRDRQEIFEEGAQVIRLGRHRFSVNTVRPDLTLIPGGAGLDVVITGTDYRQPVTDESFLAETRAWWDQLLVSEDAHVSRAEHLATSILAAAVEGRDGWNLTRLHQSAAGGANELAELVHVEAQARYEEAYERGVHDHDAGLLLDRLLRLWDTAGVLRFSPAARAAAQRWWAAADPTERELWQRRARSMARLRDTYGPSPTHQELRLELAAAVRSWHDEAGLCSALRSDAGPGPGVGSQSVAGSGEPPGQADGSGRAGQAAAYLLEELAGTDPVRFTTTAEAVELHDGLLASLDPGGGRSALTDDLGRFADHSPERHQLARAWVHAHLSELSRSDPENHSRLAPVAAEAVALLEVGAGVERQVSSSATAAEVTGLLSTHPNISDRALRFRLDELLERTEEFRLHRMPGFRTYQRRRSELLAEERTALRLDELKPKVMSAFVRNQLIDEVYLPLIGDNLAKQIGAAGRQQAHRPDGPAAARSRRPATARRRSWSTSPTASAWSS